MRHDLSKMTCIEDLRQVAKRKVPKMFFDYLESGSWTQTTLRDNTSDFTPIKLRQKVMVNTENRSLKHTLLGEEYTMPLAVAPIGLAGMLCADGEILAARAAEKFGVPYTLSTLSIASIEDVAHNTSKPFWFQLNPMRDREFMASLIQRAKNANCSALVLSADLQGVGLCHADIRNGLSAPMKPTVPNLLQLATKPEWCLRMLNTDRRTFGNIIGHAKHVHDVSALLSWANAQFDPTLNWDDIAKIKDLWGGKIILKGILDPEDAEIATKYGVDAIVVSNHGGRQLDGSLSSIQALPDIVSAVGNKTEVWLDSGIRSGQDMLKAWAMGARGFMTGRAALYGLGAFGEDGVRRALEILYREMDLTMAFTGHRQLQNVGRDILIDHTRPLSSAERRESIVQQRHRIYEELYGLPRASLRFGTMW
nr:alpha-hydroxy acid oxidase [Alysiella crassa]UOP06229.1 alpha-hydroxy-acid oxidizing protein [Alysiella crassa]